MGGGDEKIHEVHRWKSMAYHVRNNRRNPASNKKKPGMDTHGCPLTVPGTPTLKWYVLRLMSKNPCLSLSQPVTFPFHLPNSVLCFAHFRNSLSCMLMHLCMPGTTSGGQRSACRGLCYHFIMWNLGTELRSPSLAARSHLICHFLCFLSMSPNPPTMEQLVSKRL